jgi:hypothetical protein
MKKSQKWFLTVAVATAVIVVSNESMFARGGDAAKIMSGLSAAASGIQSADVAAVCGPSTQMATSASALTFC